MILWGEEEQRNERAFHACMETSDMELVTTRKEDDPMKQGALIFDEQTATTSVLTLRTITAACTAEKLLM